MSWESLLSVYRSAADSIRGERDAPPEACPDDGTPLVQGPEGDLYCPFDGEYHWPRDGRV